MDQDQMAHDLADFITLVRDLRSMYPTWTVEQLAQEVARLCECSYGVALYGVHLALKLLWKLQHGGERQ